MKASAACRAKGLLLNVTMAILLLPFFATVAPAHFNNAVLWAAATPLPQRCILWGLVIVVPLVAMLLVLWKGCGRLPLVLLLVAWFGVPFMSLRDTNHVRQMDLLIGRRSDPTAGVDVFCNGVRLGKTPLRISREEFHQQVPPWTQPPRQDRLTPNSVAVSNQQWSGAQYTWVPDDIFERFEHWPPVQDPIQDDQKALTLLSSAHYWWRIEADGHQGMVQLSSVGRGGSSGSNGHLEITPSFQATYPALEPHLALVIVGLLAENGPPTSAWLDHFRKYQNLLFLPFHEKARSDPRLREALDAVVRAEFNLPANPTPQGCDRVLAEILDRVESRGGFAIPSLESVAIDLMGDAAQASLVRCFPLESSYGSTDFGQASSGQWTMLTRKGKAARLLPLEYAVKRLRPPELFDRLVYQWGRTGRSLDLIACYQNEPAAQFIINYLHDLGRGRDRFVVDQAMPILANIVNPPAEQELRRFMSEMGGRSDEHWIVAFVESRVGAEGIDQGQLADWVFAFAPLNERTKLDLIAKINCPEAARYVQLFFGVKQDPMKRRNLICQLVTTPNPSLDPFVIDTYESSQEPSSPDYADRNTITMALIKSDTPAVREFIAKCWNNPEHRAALLDRLTSQNKADLARLTWMIPLADQLRDSPSRLKAVRLLAAIDTSAAQDLLGLWAQEGDETIREAVAQQQVERERIHAEQQKRLRQWSDLLAGKIQPEDLAPPQQPWVWDGAKYVEQEK